VPAQMQAVNWDAVPSERINDKIARKLVTGDRVMLCRWTMRAGAVVPPHRHPHEQVAYMFSGRMRMRVGDRWLDCEAGDVVVIPGGVEHEASFPTDCEVMDVFSPPREDMLSKTESYLTRG
jgi:quercetin dioxygenase-like cupin family protein